MYVCHVAVLEYCVRRYHAHTTEVEDDERS